MEEERAQGESLRVMGRGLNLGLTKVTSNQGASLPLNPCVVSYTPPCSRKDSGSNDQESHCTEGTLRQLPVL